MSGIKIWSTESKGSLAKDNAPGTQFFFQIHLIMLYNNLSAKNGEVNAVSLCTNLDLSLFLSLFLDSGWEASR